MGKKNAVQQEQTPRALNYCAVVVSAEAAAGVEAAVLSAAAALSALAADSVDADVVVWADAGAALASPD